MSTTFWNWHKMVPLKLLPALRLEFAQARTATCHTCCAMPSSQRNLLAMRSRREWIAADHGSEFLAEVTAH